MTDKDLSEQKIEFFKSCMKQFMVNKMSTLEDDKTIIHNRIQLYHLDADSYYDYITSIILVNFTVQSLCCGFYRSGFLFHKSLEKSSEDF